VAAGPPAVLRAPTPQTNPPINLHTYHEAKPFKEEDIH